ncbi:hypothetical protein [Hymenobacter guriensis]|uniref:Uncharacterized protein n=1 Tax=Hymenobacter guriensis TaxID=2793065 RepID=A0ABS0KXT3_9BACT|nr:hypothetical protein [Hymenobacter guriensis]MBG8552687.1 hypothetical protein [Hymenobacter guriensis]
MGCLLFCLAYLNYRLHYQPKLTHVSGGLVNEDVLNQLRFLQERMHNGAPADMQKVYPEGFVYLHALYGLSCLDLTAHLPQSSPVKQWALTEAAWSIDEIDSPSARLIFDEDLPLPYGAFYQGWLTYLEGRYLAVQPPAQRPPDVVARYRSRCALIAQALRQHSSPYLETYRGAAWPADAVVCVAALAGHDRLFAAQYQPELRQWLSAANTHLDSLGMIPHAADAQTGHVLQAARGSSQSQLLNFLIEIDSVYARQHFNRYRQHFLTTRLGLPGIREAANDTADVADIDSGPVILGIGGAASIVGRRTMQRYGDTTTAVGLRNSIEAFGMPFQIRCQKRYVFGQLPIADAFIAWSNALENNRTITNGTNWRLNFHLASSVLALVLYWIMRRLGYRPTTV